MTLLRADKRPSSEPWSERSRYFRGIAVRSYTVPIVEKFVERVKTDSKPTQGRRPYRTAETAVGEDEKEKTSFFFSSSDTTTTTTEGMWRRRCRTAGANRLQYGHCNERCRHGGGPRRPTCTPTGSRWRRSGPRWCTTPTLGRIWRQQTPPNSTVTQQLTRGGVRLYY